MTTKPHPADSMREALLKYATENPGAPMQGLSAYLRAIASSELIPGSDSYQTHIRWAQEVETAALLAADEFEPDRSLWNAAQDLLGRYWQLAFREGSEGVNLAEEANQVLSEFRDLLAADKPAGSSGGTECPDCRGSEFRGYKRGVRCATCDGTGYTKPQADKAVGEVAKFFLPPALHEGIAEHTSGTYRLRITGLSIRQIKEIFEDKFLGTLMWSNGSAYPTDGVEISFTTTQPQPSALPVKEGNDE